MSDSDQQHFVVDATHMTDEQLIDSWKSASDEETENLSPMLQAVVEEMDRRGIQF